MIAPTGAGRNGELEASDDDVCDESAVAAGGETAGKDEDRIECSNT